MNQTEKLLKCVAENAATGRDATEQLLKKCEDAKMRDELNYQKNQYEQVERQASDGLEKMGEKPDEKGFMAKAGMWAGVQMNTMTDKSSAHIADIMIQGATMGIIETTKVQNECPEADSESHGAASAFVTQQQDAIDRMKQFLV